MRELDEADLEQRLAGRLAELRSAQGWNLDQLAERTGISRATLSRFERGESSPGAGVLNRLCAAYGLTASQLLADVERSPLRLLRAAEQKSWRDKAGGLTRHLRCPPLAGFATELLEIELAAGHAIDYDRAPIDGLEHHLLMLSGRLLLTVNGQVQELKAGDTLSYQCRGASRFEALGAHAARYLLAITTPSR